MKNTGKVVFLVTAITLITKILSFLSVTFYTSYFGGDDIYLKVYSYSIGIPDYIFTAVGTSLTTIVIPIYSSLLSRKEDKRAKIFIDNIISISCVLVVVLLVFSNLLIPFLLNFTTYKNDAEIYKYAVFTLRLILPVMFFFCINYILIGILQSHDKFKMAAAVSLPSSLSIILYMVFFADKYGVTGLTYAYVIGFSLQPLMLLPQVIKLGYRYKFRFDLKNQDIIRSAKLVPAVLLGVSGHQVNMLYNGNLSTIFGTETLIRLVQNIMLTPVLAFVYSITAIYYPRLSAYWEQEDMESYKKSLNEIISVMVFYLIPAAVGLFILRYNVIDLTSKWKEFSSNDAYVASNILGCYSFGLIFIGLKEIFDRSLYAQKSTLPSAIVGILIMITNVSVSLLLKEKAGTYCMPIAYSVSSLVGAMSLYMVLKRKIGKISNEIFANVLKSLLSACIMGIAVYFSSKFLYGLNYNSEIMGRIIILFIPVALGAVIYFIATYILKVKQSTVIFERVILLLGRKKAGE